MEYDNRNSGALFINDRKATERHPDWNGKLNIDGVDHWISGWKKQGQKGPFLSLSLGAACEKQAESRPAPQQEPRTAPRTTTNKYPPSESQGHASDDIPW